MGKTILGVIAGVSIGAIAGILMAPDKGSATRRKLAEHTNDLGKLLNYWAADLIDDVAGRENNSGISVMEKEYAATIDPDLTPAM